MKYYWDRNDIEKDFKDLKKAYKESSTEEEKNAIMNAIKETEEIIEDIDSSFGIYKKELGYQESLDLLADTVPTFEFVYPYLEKLLSILKDDALHRRFSFSFDSESSNKNLTEDDAFGLVHDFFKGTTKKIYDAFLSIYNNRYKTARFLDSHLDYVDGYSYFIPYLNKGYIDVSNSKQDYVDGLLTLTHECAHITTAMINPNRYGFESAFFNEIETIFMELIASDYFEKTMHDKSFSKTSVDKLEHYYFAADDVLDKKRITEIRLSMGNPPYNEFRDSMNDEFYKALLTVEPLRNIDIDVKYLFSYIVAVELYEVYRKDKELAFHLLDTIIRADNEKENEAILKTVEPVKSLRKYKNRIT